MATRWQQGLLGFGAGPPHVFFTSVRFDSYRRFISDRNTYQPEIIYCRSGKQHLDSLGVSRKRLVIFFLLFAKIPLPFISCLGAPSLASEKPTSHRPGVPSSLLGKKHRGRMLVAKTALYRLSTTEKLRLKNAAQGQRFLIARRALVRCLWEGKKPVALWFYEAWLKKSGVKILVDNTYFAIKTSKQTSADSSGEVDNKVRETADLLVRAAGPLKNATYLFVRDDLNLPWSCVAEDLFRIFFGITMASIFDSNPMVTFEFKQLSPNRDIPTRRAGESLRTYGMRLIKLDHELQGRMPKNEGKHIELGVEWFYRHHILKESKRHIARNVETYSDAERTVRIAIDNVQDILNRSPYRFQCVLPPENKTRS